MGKIALIYAVRRQVYVDCMLREVDNFQAVIPGEIDVSIINCHVSPLADDYELKGRELADCFRLQDVDGFVFRNSYKYDSRTRKAVRIEVVDEERRNIKGVPRDKLRSFRRGLLRQMVGV
ncbi:MAG: hypothetical protein KKB21_00970 [Nanoarchaeota archaeon]|nr:hypothetical protein [Nanoarchaeota archaeon]MBU4086127.1 hypothetical protein [Nanoarchaeota archaeon]